MFVTQPDTVARKQKRAKRPVMTGRGGGIRTHDPLLPKQMRYQAALRPEEARILQAERTLVNHHLDDKSRYDTQRQT